MSLLGYLGVCFFMFVTHAVPSAPGIRPWLRLNLGARLFTVLYSVISLVATGLFIWGYITVDASVLLYSPLPFSPQIALALMPVALLLMIGRITTPYGEQERPLPPQGIYLIARFPGSFGILLWASLHLLATGDAKRVIAFSTFFLIALFALLKNQWVLKNTQSEEAIQFRMETRIVPFHLMLTEGQRFNFNEIGWRRVLLTLITFVVVICLHPIVLSVNPVSWIY